MAGQRVRRIVVDGRTYRWRVRHLDERRVGLRVWRDGHRVPIADVRIRFDDPWLRFPEMAYVNRTAPERFHQVFALEPVRPHQVAQLIRACLDHGGQARGFDLVDGRLLPVPNPRQGVRGS